MKEKFLQKMTQNEKSNNITTNNYNSSFNGITINKDNNSEKNLMTKCQIPN